MASFYLQDLHIRQIIQNAFLNISKEVVTKIPTRYGRIIKLYTSSTFSNVIANYLLSARYSYARVQVFEYYRNYLFPMRTFHTLELQLPMS